MTLTGWKAWAVGAVLVVGIIVGLVDEAREHTACWARGGEMVGTGQHVPSGSVSRQVEQTECDR